MILLVRGRVVGGDDYGSWAGFMRDGELEDRGSSAEVSFVANSASGLILPVLRRWYPVAPLLWDAPRPLGYVGDGDNHRLDRLDIVSRAQHGRGRLPRHAVQHRDPTLLLYGEADVRSTVAVGEDLRARIPGSTLVLRPGQVETPKAFNSAVRAFLRRS